MRVERSLPPQTSPSSVFEQAHALLSAPGFTLESQEPGRLTWKAPRRPFQPSLLLFAARITVEVIDRELRVEADLSSLQRRFMKGRRFVAFGLGLPGLVFALLITGELLSPAPLLILGGAALAVELLGRLSLAGQRARARWLLESFGEKLAHPPARLELDPDPGLQLSPRAPAQTCSYCRDVLGEEPAMVCPRCETRFHAECWQEHGACPSLGCARPVPTDKARVC